MTAIDSTLAGAVLVGAKRHIGAPEIVARLDYIETALFGSPLIVTAAQPPTREPEPHKCMPAIVEPDIAKAAETARDALAVLIADEAKNLELLTRLEKIACAIREDPTLLNDEIRRELRAGYKVVDLRYGSGGQTTEMEELGCLGEDAAQPIGIQSGNQIPLSDGRQTSASYGHVQAYLNAEHDIQDAVDRYTCELCLPNFMAMIEADVARGFIRLNGDRYEWVKR